MIDKLKDSDGTWSWKKIGALFLVPLTMWTLSTWYGRYSWMRDQCYKVATNENLVVKTGENLEKKDIDLQKQIDNLKDDLDKKIGIAHGRMTGETEKREAKDDQLMQLIIDLLKQQQRQLEVQQEQLEKVK